MLLLKAIRHQYQEKEVLQLAEWNIEAASQWLLLGQSGSGKSTLLHIIATLLRPSQGEIWFDGQALHRQSGSALDRFRARHIGLIFQKAHFINSLKVLDNLLLARYWAGLPKDKKYCLTLLEELGIADKARQHPSQLSQGEAQRLSVARALLNETRLILADEPTASLDDHNSRLVVELLKTQAQKHGSALLIATHDQRVKAHFSLCQSLDKPTP